MPNAYKYYMNNQLFKNFSTFNLNPSTYLEYLTFVVMQNAYSLLIGKLRAFTQKYYQNLLLRGLILCFSSIAFGFIAIATLEYYGRFGIEIRTLLFWAFILISSLIFCFWVIAPILKLAKLGDRLSDAEAAKIIGLHFPGVADKLLNVIQLKQQSSTNLALLEASIDQKAIELKPIPFIRAINFSENRRFIKYALVPIFIFGGLYVAGSEGVITESTARLINHKTEYIPPAPFQFVLLDDKNECIQHQDYKLKVQLIGDEIPTDAYLQLNGLPIKMMKLANHTFEYTFNNIQNTVEFKINAGGLYSDKYALNVLAAPSLINFDIYLDYPNYTDKKDEFFENIGELLIPEGTRVSWNFHTENTDEFEILWAEKKQSLELVSPNHFRLFKKAKASTNYTLLPRNQQVATTDSVNYLFKVIKDGYPIVDATEIVDSTQLKVRYFKGQIKDDYGFTKLQFVIKKQNNNWDSIIPIPLEKDMNLDNFFFVFDMKGIDLGGEESLEYFFEVYDNDAVNGSKKSQSRAFEFTPPSLEELQDQNEVQTDELKKLLTENVELAKELQEEFEELRMKLLNKEELNWEDKQQVSELLEKQKKLEQNIDKIAQKNKEKNAMMNEFSEQDKRILDKQKQLEELMEELMTDEMRELFDEMEKLMEEMKTDEWMEKLEELQMNNEELEKELDRNLEMLKKFEFEQALEESIDKLEELKNKQEELKRANDEKTSPQEHITEEQKKLSEAFKKLSEKLDALQEKNDALEKREALDDTKDIQESIKQQMQESQENSESKKRKKTSKSQEKTLDKMEQLQEMLKKAQQQSGEKGPAEDMDALRQILENLIDLSLDEEALLSELSETNINDPEYVSLIHWQNKLSDDSKILEDSLYALSKRQVQIKATINREMGAITSNIKKSLENMAERESSKALTKQQLVMTSANNLALMLSDVLQAMQEDMADKMPGQQQCNKPGSGNPSPSDMKKMQEQLKKQLEEMKKGNENGKKPKGKKGQGKDLAKMMAKQELIRQQLEKMADKIEEGENGKAEGLRDAINKMEQTEEEIANDNITQETLNRQNQIIEHLLEAEKAEQERDKEKKREAKEAQQLPHQVKDLLEEYKRNKLKQAELLKTIPPKLRPYYKEKVKDYFQQIEPQ